MKVFVVYCHPSPESFTHRVKESFIGGLAAAGHEYILSDLYQMGFASDMTPEEYMRETYYNTALPVPDDVAAEQKKLQQSDAVVFIYPVFWTEAPAKLVGWFDRVWTVGFSYGPEAEMKKLKKALCIACAGKTLDSLEKCGEIEAMKCVMLGDRIHDRADEKSMIILDGITHADEKQREVLAAKHLETAYRAGYCLAQ